MDDLRTMAEVQQTGSSEGIPGEATRQMLLKTIELYPQMASARANLGRWYAQQGFWEQAVALYQEAIRLQPDNAIVYRSLARAWHRLEESEKASIATNRAQELQSNSITRTQRFGKDPLLAFQEEDVRQQENGSDGKEGNVKIFFYPDYRETNPYQSLLYSDVPENYLIEPGSIDTALESLEKNREDKTYKAVVFHLHWTSVLLGRAKTLAEAQMAKFSFIEKIYKFVRKGGYLVWTIHNLYPHECQYLDEEIELRTTLCQVASKIHLHSKNALAEVAKHYPISREKIQIIPHGSYVGVYQNNITRMQARHYFGFSENEFVFLFFGQIRPYKGTDELISAFTKTCEKISNVRLIVAGQPKYLMQEKSVKAQVEKIPEITVVEEFIPDEDLQWFFNAADVVVLPYRQVLTSGSLVAALSFGCPVIVPNHPTIQDWVRDGENGFIYELGDVDSLVQVMLEVANFDKERREVLSKNAFDGIKALSWENCVQLLFEEYSRSNVKKMAVSEKVK